VARPVVRATRRLALLGLGAWAFHASDAIRAGHAERLLWGCHAGALGIVIGLWARAPRVIGPNAFMALVGVVLWPVDVVVTGDIDAPSTVAHLVGATTAFAALRLLGLPRGTWVRAGASMVALIALARLVTSPAENVNLAFAVHPSAADVVRSHALYLAGVVGLVTLGFFALERTLLVVGFARAIETGALTPPGRHDELTTSAGEAPRSGEEATR
jgi:hypothetical protein